MTYHVINPFCKVHLVKVSSIRWVVALDLWVFRDIISTTNAYLYLAFRVFRKKRQSQVVMTISVKAESESPRVRTHYGSKLEHYRGSELTDTHWGMGWAEANSDQDESWKNWLSIGLTYCSTTLTTLKPTLKGDEDWYPDCERIVTDQKYKLEWWERY